MSSAGGTAAAAAAGGQPPGAAVGAGGAGAGSALRQPVGMGLSALAVPLTVSHGWDLFVVLWRTEQGTGN